MTTRAAEALYEAQHVLEHEGKGWAVVNPKGLPVADLPVIYGYNNSGPGGGYFLSAQLMAQDGTALGGHGCSSEAYMPADLGVLEGTRPDRHETFLAHYPDGYRMEFVRGADVLKHEGLMAAYELNQRMAELAKAGDQS